LKQKQLAIYDEFKKKKKKKKKIILKFQKSQNFAVNYIRLSFIKNDINVFNVILLKVLSFFVKNTIIFFPSKLFKLFFIHWYKFI